MKEMILRYGSLVFLTLIILYQSYIINNSVVHVIILLTITLLSYFLIPIIKQPLINYLIIISALPLAVVFNLNIEYLLIYVSFFLVEATWILKEWDNYIIISFSTIVCLTLSLFEFLPLESLLQYILFAISLFFLHRAVKGKKEKDELYEQLLIQYRKLKRISVEQEELVRAEERTKIARDMHDSVGHKLTALLMQLEVMNLTTDDSSVQNIKQLAKESLEETRFAVRQLKLNETSGIQSVIQLIRKLEMESHLMIKFTLEKGILSIPLSNKQSIVLYRVLQESLTNAMKHSESKEVVVTLTMNALDHVHFSVINKIYKIYPIVQGFGVTNMKERLQEIGGDLRITKDHQQFIVEGTFPLRRENV